MSETSEPILQFFAYDHLLEHLAADQSGRSAYWP